jgi:hypothetical protein
VAALLVTVVGRSSSPATMVVVTLVGGAIGLLAYVSAETAWLAAIVLALVCYLTGLAYAYGPTVGRVGYLLLLWAMTILIGEARGGDPATTAVAFFVGGAAAIGVALVRERVGGERPPGEADAGGGEPVSARPSLADVARSDLGIWSLVRAGLTIVAVALGYQLLANDLDPFWVAIPLLVVLVPDRDRALFKAAQRGIGTSLGWRRPGRSWRCSGRRRSSSCSRSSRLPAPWRSITRTTRSTPSSSRTRCSSTAGSPRDTTSMLP